MPPRTGRAAAAANDDDDGTHSSSTNPPQPTNRPPTADQQINMRAQAFQMILTNSAGDYLALSFFVLSFFLHVGLSMLMAGRFIHGIKNLAQVRRLFAGGLTRHKRQQSWEGSVARSPRPPR